MSKGNFFMIDNHIFEHKLPPVAFCIYCYLKRCENRERGCFPSKKTIADACGVAMSSVSKHIKLLDEKGLIIRRARIVSHRHTSNLYLLPVLPPPLDAQTSIVHQTDGVICHSDTEQDQENKQNLIQNKRKRAGSGGQHLMRAQGLDSEYDE